MHTRPVAWVSLQALFHSFSYLQLTGATSASLPYGRWAQKAVKESAPYPQFSADFHPRQHVASYTRYLWNGRAISIVPSLAVVLARLSPRRSAS